MSANDLEQGMRLAGEGRLGEAEAALKRFVAANPRHAQALSILGALNLHQGDHERALGYFERSLNIEPNQPQSWNGQGVCLFELGRFGEAVAAYDRALRLAPNFAPAHSNKGNALQRLLRYDEAIASYDAALALDPRFAAALSNRAGALVQTNRLNEALTSAERALALQPNDAEALARRGDALAGLKRFRDAVRSYDQALTLDPQLPQRLGNKLTALMTACQWDELDATRAALDAALQAGQCAADPFVLVFASNDPAQQRVAARLYAARFQPADAAPPLSAKSKIRIGYFSADFYSHATASLLTEMLELHDGTVFETYGFAFGDTPHDPWRERFERAFDHFHDVSSRSDADIAAFARAAELDIAIDLKGHTGKARTGIFAQRAAPIQVSWLGYPATMGARFIDYLIADPVLIREGEEHFYDEKIAFLPDTYQSNDRQRPVSGRTWTRAELGLPENGFVFCCFNNTYKITPDVFALWMRLLREVPDSVLWLLESNGEAKENLRAAATRQGVDAARLVFAPLIDMRDHLGRPAQANLFLDTFPCTAHTTASDALWAGLPVLTREGETFASRVAASVLRAAGLPDLITRTDEEYAALALGLARHRDRLTALRARLGANRQTSPLFDTPKFTREIEALYVRMVERQRAGAPPDHLRA